MREAARTDPQWLISRRVVERVRITGRLILDTPAHFGNGDSDGLTDISLARDALTGQPLLTGTSIAGALRNYLREFERGFEWAEAHDGATWAEQLFGHLHTDDKASVQSWLVVEDALGVGAHTELRDGVAITPRTRTAEDGLKFDLELISAGTYFELGFELALSGDDARRQLWLGALITALQGFGQTAGEGQITLGTRKRRGLGQCHVEGWRTHCFAMADRQEFLDWLRGGAGRAQDGLPEAVLLNSQRYELRLTAEFEVEGSLLVRSDTGNPNAADMVHLRSRRGGQAVPILPGTSLAGALRGRALRIANTVLGEAGPALVEQLFGPRNEPGGSPRPLRSSRLSVGESDITGGVADRIQNRLKIDRFTGGAYPSALFSQQPLWSVAGSNAAVLTIDLRVRRPAGARPEDFEAWAGLLLLLLKDLWTGDLALGGESSVGRGRLKGRSAALELDGQRWQLLDGTAITITPPEAVATLEAWVASFNRWAPVAQEA